MFAQKILKSQKAFTLIETLIYAVIVSGVIGFVLLATYQIIDSDERIVLVQELTENQKFVSQKISWALSNVSVVNSPASENSGASLSVDKINYSYNPVIISLNSGVIELTNGATTTSLTNDYVTVSSLDFEHLNLSGRSAIRATVILENDIGSTTINATILLE